MATTCDCYDRANPRKDLGGRAAIAVLSHLAPRGGVIQIMAPAPSFRNPGCPKSNLHFGRFFPPRLSPSWPFLFDPLRVGPVHLRRATSSINLALNHQTTRRTVPNLNCHLHPRLCASALAQKLSFRPKRPDFFFRAVSWRVGPRSAGIPAPTTPAIPNSFTLLLFNFFTLPSLTFAQHVAHSARVFPPPNSYYRSAAVTSVFPKSLPLNSSASPATFASAYEKQSPKFNPAAWRPLP